MMLQSSILATKQWELPHITNKVSSVVEYIQSLKSVLIHVWISYLTSMYHLVIFKILQPKPIWIKTILALFRFEDEFPC